jgi:hypothetical protein
MSILEAMNNESRGKMKGSGVEFYRQAKLDFILQTLTQLTTCVTPPEDVRDEAVKYTEQFLNEQKAMDYHNQREKQKRHK